MIRIIVTSWMACWLVFWPLTVSESADVQTAESDRTGASPSDQLLPVVKAWAAVLQGVSALRTYVETRELTGVHSEDMPLSVAVSVLSSEARHLDAAARDEVKLALLAFSRKVSELHAAADDFDQASAATLLADVLAQHERLSAFYDDATLVAARRLAERHTCPMHPDVVGRSTEQCPKCGMVLDQAIRIPLAYAGASPAGKTVSASIRTAGMLRPGERIDATLRLTAYGRPVLMTDLRWVHTEQIHLLIIDPSLTDYHHVHPRPTETAGEYAFSFTPRTHGPYRAWADVRTTLTGLQEYAIADIWSGETAQGELDRTVNLRAQDANLRFELRLAGSQLIAGQPIGATLRVTDVDGGDFSSLEPLMGTFAHLVGFSEDHTTVLHAHPRTVAPLSPGDRGGPELEFQLYATRVGFHRFFVQVQVEGESRFAAFGLQVVPAE